MFLYQTEETETLPFIRMLKERSVVLDFEGFRHQKNTFIVKELAITNSDYSDSLIFLPPVNFNSLPKSEQKAYNWLTKYLHGLHWDSGNYLNLKLNQIIQSFVLRNPNAIFYAKGKDKASVYLLSTRTDLLPPLVSSALSALEVVCGLIPLK